MLVNIVLQKYSFVTSYCRHSTVCKIFHPFQICFQGAWEESKKNFIVCIKLHKRKALTTEKKSILTEC